jgi:nucleoside 2-deoxyribosyltransferase
MMKKIKIYLAGKMSGLSYEQMYYWRKFTKDLLEDAASEARYSAMVINPVDFYNYENRKHQSEAEVEDYDLAHVVTSDLIVVNLEGLDSSDGTKIELHDANYHHKIPVIAFGDLDTYENLHPWIKRDITRVENSIEDVVQYIKDFYLI